MGLGTMPLSIVWQAFAVCFALGGITANAIYFSVARALPISALAISLPVAAVFAYAATRLVSNVFGRLAPAPGKTSMSRKDLIGKTGIAISSKVSDEFGEVRITDSTGIVHRVICRTLPGEEAIPEGREVVFVDYDRERDHLFVAPFDVDAPPRRRRSRIAAAPKAGSNRVATDEDSTGENESSGGENESSGEPPKKAAP
jgi:membrane protein implicated in regulation of membrane protease activity